MKVKGLLVTMVLVSCISLGLVACGHASNASSSAKASSSSQTQTAVKSSE